MANFNEVDGVEKDQVKVNGSEYSCIFDSASNINIVSNNFIKQIPGVKINQRPISESIKLINGQAVKLRRYVKLEIEYRHKSAMADFYILGNSVADLLIGNPLINKLEDRKKFPLKCAIPTRGGTIVSRSRPIRSIAEKREFQELVESFEKRGIIEESRSLWLNPVVIIRKKTGAIRFCIDLRRVNDLVDLDRFELPRIQDTIRSLHGQKYFSIVDLKDGYFQVDIEEKDREKTTFIDGIGRLMQFRKMPQGFKNSPAIFQRGMQLILKDHIPSKCVVYIDDILIFGRNKDEHDRNLELVTDRLEQYGLEINSDKMIVREKTVKFLGFEITQNKILPLRTRSEGIINFPIPSTQKQLRKFLGLLNYDRTFIKDLSSKVNPLYTLLERKTRKLEMGKESIKTFNEVKKLWAENLELRMPSEEGKFTLETDASDIGLGAVLKQEGSVIAYISRVLKGAEVNYSITEKETLAAIWAMEKLEYWLVGREFVLVSGHKAIESIRSKVEFGTKRIQRWMSRLERFNFVVMYKQGSELVEADTLSRNCQREDKVDQILTIHRESGHRKDIHSKVLENGIDISRQELQKIISSCDTCLVYDRVRVRGGSHIISSEIGERVAIDVMDIDKRYKVVLAIDYFTRKAWGMLFKRKIQENVTKVLEAVYKDIKFKELLSDNGKEFDNELVKKWCSDREIKHEFSIPYYHQGNGRVERLNRTIRECIKKDKGLYAQRLNSALKTYNNNIHRALGMSPNEAMNPVNHDRIRDKMEKYAKEFKSRNLNDLKEGDCVYIQNESPKSKMDKVFDDTGKITECEPNNGYKVKLDNGGIIRRHRTQLKFRQGNVVDDVHG